MFQPQLSYRLILPYAIHVFAEDIRSSDRAFPVSVQLRLAGQEFGYWRSEAQNRENRKKKKRNDFGIVLVH